MTPAAVGHHDREDPRPECCRRAGQQAARAERQTLGQGDAGRLQRERVRCRAAAGRECVGIGDGDRGRQRRRRRCVDDQRFGGVRRMGDENKGDGEAQPDQHSAEPAHGHSRHRVDVHTREALRLSDQSAARITCLGDPRQPLDGGSPSVQARQSSRSERFDQDVEATADMRSVARSGWRYAVRARRRWGRVPPYAAMSDPGTVEARGRARTGRSPRSRRKKGPWPSRTGRKPMRGSRTRPRRVVPRGTLPRPSDGVEQLPTEELMYRAVPAQVDLPALEHDVLAFWRDKTSSPAAWSSPRAAPSGSSTRVRPPPTACPAPTTSRPASSRTSSPATGR